MKAMGRSKITPKKGKSFGSGRVPPPMLFNLSIADNFKFSRRRLRIGIYGVLSDGNQIKPQTDWKISFAIFN